MKIIGAATFHAKRQSCPNPKLKCASILDAIASANTAVDNIPIGTCVNFATEKNSKRKKLRAKKFLSLTGTTFCPGRELPPQPLPEESSLIQELVEVAALG
jgi:hypothetical protein